VTSSDPELGDLAGVGKNFEFFIGNSTASAVAGYGTITVPAAYVGHLPVGISFIGGRWSEPALIGFAYDFEQATHARVPPTFLAHETGATAARANADRRAIVPNRGRHSTMLPAR
jgi:hypothetical protein